LGLLPYQRGLLPRFWLAPLSWQESVHNPRLGCKSTGFEPVTDWFNANCSTRWANFWEFDLGLEPRFCRLRSAASSTKLIEQTPFPLSKYRRSTQFLVVLWREGSKVNNYTTGRIRSDQRLAHQLDLQNPHCSNIVFIASVLSLTYSPWVAMQVCDYCWWMYPQSVRADCIRPYINYDCQSMSIDRDCLHVEGRMQSLVST
jgi:hypothetical protein